ncbi:MAG: hypothetical protein OEZ34_06135 [Spirochaetia bacterium]|nr:hypothetical protein [Spirochaetia bacterium]
MDRYSISFIFVVLILGFMIGTVSGSLLDQIFGLSVLNQSLFGESYQLINNFYLIKRLDVKLTPAGLIGLGISIWLLYKKG